MLNNPNWKQPEVNTAEPDEIGKIYLEMIDTINERGWCQGHLIDINGSVCAAGAYSETQILSTDNDISIWKASHKAWQTLVHSVGDSVAEWNDVPGRTKEQVIEKLKELAYAQR